MLSGTEKILKELDSPFHSQLSDLQRAPASAACTAPPAEYAQLYCGCQYNHWEANFAMLLQCQCRGTHNRAAAKLLVKLNEPFVLYITADPAALQVTDLLSQDTVLAQTNVSSVVRSYAPHKASGMFMSL